MTIIEVLTAIKEAGIKVSPFTNYDKVTEAEYADNGVSFKPNETEWPIHNISITSAGNLNISFEQEGVLTEPDGTTHNCKQYRQICIVRDGELYQQFLQVTKDKTEQARLTTVKIKNNIINLGDYPLTDKTTVNIDEIFSEKVKDFVGSLQKAAPGTAFPKMNTVCISSVCVRMVSTARRPRMCLPLKIRLPKWQSRDSAPRPRRLQSNSRRKPLVWRFLQARSTNWCMPQRF